MHIYENKSNDWQVENRPHLNAVLKRELFSCGLNNRVRLEYRNRETTDNCWRYRNKLTIKLPMKFTKLEIQPYLADEIFYDFDAKTLNRNRLYGGTSFVLSENIKAEIYYLWETTEKIDKWTDVHILGTKLKLLF